MKRLIVGIFVASCALTGLPGIAAAQCEGGPTVAGMYAPNGVYIPGHCAYTNATTPGQLYPSGAQPGVTSNPAAGLSALPGQLNPTGPLPGSGTGLGPAPGYYSSAYAAPAAPGALVAPAAPGTLVAPSAGNQTNLAYNFSLPAAPPREPTASPPPAASDDGVVFSYPNQ
jgi:hypothetical protein